MARGWWSLADVLLERAIAERVPEPPADPAAADAAVAGAREQFRAALTEPSPFAVLVHNAGLTIEEPSPAFVDAIHIAGLDLAQFTARSN